MFTGIIQSIGIVADLRRKGAGARLQVKTDWGPEDVRIGESIAVDGCCLTVTEKKNNIFCADLSDESLRLSTFAYARAGNKVNLERALRLCDRLGGHIVTGHVDGVGEILAIKKTSGSVQIQVGHPKNFSKYLVHKGSVAVDGVSLTVSLDEKNSHLRKSAFSVYIIPHTEAQTTLVNKKVGDRVNLEFDYLAKVVEGLKK